MITLAKYLYHILALIGICFTIYTGYDSFFKNKNLTLDVKTILVNKYETPKNSKLTNVYQVRFKIKNIGEKTIVGQGNNKDLLDDNLTLYFAKISGFNLKEAYHIFPLDYSSSSNNELQVSFKQWMPHDFVEFVFDIKLKDEHKPFNIYISKHQIKNGQITYSKGSMDDISFYRYENKIYLKSEN